MRKIEQIDVIIPLGDNPSKNDNLELRFALRSIEKNLLDVRHVYVVTNKLPDWLDNVIHVKCSDTLKHNKDGNIINKVLAALENSGEQHIDVLDRFVFMADDNIIVKPMKSIELGYYHLGSLAKKKFDINNNWHIKLENGLNKLQQEKKPVWNWESHCPVVMEKFKFINTYRMHYPEFDEEEQGYTIYTMYFNNYIPKVFTLAKDIKSTYEDKIDQVKDPKFIVYNDKGFTETLQKVLQNMFPGTSKYERSISSKEAEMMHISQNALQKYTEQLRDELLENYVNIYKHMRNHRTRLVALLHKAGREAYPPIDKDIRNIDLITEVIASDITLHQFNTYVNEIGKEYN